MERVRKEAFWLYGVIVGLAVREALTITVPHFALKSQVVAWMVRLEAWRLVVFLAVIVRFYLGSATYFDKVYDNPETADSVPKKNYSLDYILGFLNFLMFFGWSATIPVPDRLMLGISQYLWFLTAIILFDAVWLIVSWKYDSTKFIKGWVFYNVSTFLICALIFAVTEGISGNSVLAEELAFPFILLISAVDIIEVTRGKQYLLDFLRRTFS